MMRNVMATSYNTWILRVKFNGQYHMQKHNEYHRSLDRDKMFMM